MYPVFRKNFWLSEKAAAKRARRSRARNFYIWGSLHRARNKLGTHHFLNSTTAGDSTIRNFAAEGSTGSQTPFEDPDYHAVRLPSRALHSLTERRDGLVRSFMETLTQGHTSVLSARTGREHDVEKNETEHTTRVVAITRSASSSDEA